MSSGSLDDNSVAMGHTSPLLPGTRRAHGGGDPIGGPFNEIWPAKINHQTRIDILALKELAKKVFGEETGFARFRVTLAMSTLAPGNRSRSYFFLKKEPYVAKKIVKTHITFSTALDGSNNGCDPTWAGNKQ